MKKLILIIVMACFIGSVAHAEQPWNQIAHLCAKASEDEMHARTGCASCADSWRGAALCAVNTYYRGQVPEAQTRSCIDRIYAARLNKMTCNQCGNPIEDTFRCVRGE